MEIIKERCAYNGRCVIRTNSYASSLSHFLVLFTQACQDFPGLTAAEVEVKQYAGQRYKRTFGIEFAPKSEVPDSYEEVAQLEYTM